MNGYFSNIGDKWTKLDHACKTLGTNNGSRYKDREKVLYLNLEHL